MNEKLNGIEKMLQKPVENLRTKLFDSQHPYGLLLMTLPLVAATGGSIDSAGLSSSSLVIHSSSTPEQNPTARLFSNLSSAGAFVLGSAGHAPEASFVAGLSILSSGQAEKDESYSWIGGGLLLLGFLAAIDPALAAILERLFNFTGGKSESIVALGLADQNILESKKLEKMVDISDRKIRMGCISAEVLDYKGNTPYIVKDSMGKESQVEPGEKLIMLHVNQKSTDLKKYSPFARTRTIKRDFQNLCKLLNNPSNFELSNEARQTIESLKDSPIIGVSHLVRLVTSKNIPTWDLNILPKYLQQFHRIDSQIVSYFFGGRRKVSTDDISMMFLPADTRTTLI